MKLLLRSIIILSLVFSCAHKGVRTQLSSKEQDSLHEESFMRYGESRFKEVERKKDSLLVELMSCYKGEQEQALSRLKAKLKEEENNPYYWVVIGNCFLLKENTDTASFYFQKALSKKPEQYIIALIKNNQGLIQLKHRNYELAYKLFSESIKMSPKSLTPTYNLAQIHIQFGHIQKAEQTLLPLEKKAPEDIDVLSSLGTIALMKGNNKNAIRYFERIPERYRIRQDMAINYALALYQDGLLEESRAFMLKTGLISSKYLRKIERNLSSRIDEKLNQ